jgi:beta-N-acetylhexosaminidase
MTDVCAPGPLDLAPDQEDLITATLDRMPVEALVGQLMCVYHLADDGPALSAELDRIGLRPGGLLVAGLRSSAQTGADVRWLQQWSDIGLLVAANLESGTSTFLTDGEPFANPMQIAASGDATHARRLGEFCAAYARSVGVNWAFAPVLDIAVNHRNPITGTRTFGADAALAAELGTAYIGALQERRVAASAKHWPGDGVDDRDQHLVTSVNTMSMPQWHETFGRAYRTAIEAGVMTIMAGHIALPAYRPDDADAYLPGSLRSAILTDLLRGELGFDGLIVSDNNLMAGFTRCLPRQIALPQAVNAGCDILLGSQFVAEDYQILVNAVAAGVISLDRLRSAAKRILRLKARLGLIGDPAPQNQPPLVDTQRFAAWQRAIAQDSITLAKQTDDVLPVTAQRYPRVLVYVIGDHATFYDPANGLAAPFVAGLEARGMQVTVRPQRNQATERAAQEQVDLIIYFANRTFTSESNTARVMWSYPQGPEAPRRPDIPMVLVSIADPYHLQDMPSIGTAVNGYTPSAHTVDATLACLAGEAEFRGTSPIDPFCGYTDAVR